MNKFLPLFFLLVFSIGFSSAFDSKYDSFDKVFSVSDVDKKIVLDVQLLTPLNNYVPRGYQKVAEFQVNSYDSLKFLVAGLELYDVDNSMKSILRSFDLKIKTSALDKEGNLTYVWEDLSKVNFEKDDEIIVGIFTDVREGDVVEWIPIFTIDDSVDFRVSQWAVWTESLNVDILSYWKLDDDDFSDELGANDGTNSGTLNTTGKINDGRSFRTIGSYFIDIGNNTIDLTDGNFTLNGWVYLETTSSDLGFGQALIGGENSAFAFYISSTTNTLTLGKVGVDEAPKDSTSLSASTWYMISVSYDADANVVQYYLNGTAGDNESYSTTFSATNMYIGKNGEEDSSFNGTIDEVGVWTRVLSDAEITYLYNNGVGVIYVADFVKPNITEIYAPIGILSSKNVSYTFNAVDDIGLESCWYWVTRGASEEVANTSVSCINATNFTNSFIVSSDADYVFHLFVNDSVAFSKYSNSSFSVDTTTGSTSPAGGGGSSLEGYGEVLEMLAWWKALMSDNPVQEWNPNVAPELDVAFDEFFNSVTLDNMFSNSWDVFRLSLAFIFRQPAYLGENPVGVTS